MKYNNILMEITFLNGFFFFEGFFVYYFAQFIKRFCFVCMEFISNKLKKELFYLFNV